MPIVVIPTCKSGDRRLQRTIIELVEDVYVELGHDTKFGAIEAMYSDGDALRRQAFVDSELYLIDPDSTLGHKLVGLYLLDRAVARRNRTRAMDPKHIVKRVRGLFKSTTRGTRVGADDGFKHTASSVNVLLVKTGTDGAVADRMLKPKDDQSVPEAVALCRAIVALPQKAATLERPDEKLRATDLALWAAMVDGMLAVALELESDLSSIVRRALQRPTTEFQIPLDFQST